MSAQADAVSALSRSQKQIQEAFTFIADNSKELLEIRREAVSLSK